MSFIFTSYVGSLKKFSEMVAGNGEDHPEEED
jgi:hypothetical protein